MAEVRAAWLESSLIPDASAVAASAAFRGREPFGLSPDQSRAVALLAQVNGHRSVEAVERWSDLSAEDRRQAEELFIQVYARVLL